MLYAMHAEIEKTTKDEWISVDDRLPALSGRYVVYDYKNTEVYTAYFSDDCFSDEYLLEECTDEITHWQPIPKPPTTKETK